MSPTASPAPLLALALAAAACGDDGAADVAGTYTIVLTNRDNGCDLTNWTVGAASDPIAVVVTQDFAGARPPQ